MTLWFLAYLGGMLTILSPCILPVLPFVFSQSQGPFRKNGLPLLLGMASTFSLFALLAIIGGEWVIKANDWGRGIALVLMAFFALTLLFPSLSEKVTRPFTKLGGQLNNQYPQKSFVLGVATGLLWAPCAGPILGLILTGAALKGITVTTSFLLIAYALGAATSLALALMAGGKFFHVMERYLGADRMVRVVLGVAVLIGVLSIALSWDKKVLANLSTVNTNAVEEKLLSATQQKEEERPAPELLGANAWINSSPLSLAGLKGKVVLIDFWTYSCINCLRALPYVKAWHERYQREGLVVIGVHTPEFAFEKVIANVKKAVSDLHITWPVAIDNDYRIWNAFQNHYWPAHYFLDAKGRIRHEHFGEGDYVESEKIIRGLLKEIRKVPLTENTSSATSRGTGVQALAEELQSPETYLGLSRAQNQIMDPKQKLSLNEWRLSGKWKSEEEKVVLKKAHGKISFRFHARDLHLVLGPGESGKAIRFRVTLDGKIPGKDHGMDVTENGYGTIGEERLYQLIRQSEKKRIQDRTFEIEFFDEPVEAYAFTFG